MERLQDRALITIISVYRCSGPVIWRETSYLKDVPLTPYSNTSDTLSMLHPLLPRPRTTSPRRRRPEDLENRIVVPAFTFFCTSPRQRYFSFDDVLQGLVVVFVNLVVVII